MEKVDIMPPSANAGRAARPELLAKGLPSRFVPRRLVDDRVPGPDSVPDLGRDTGPRPVSRAAPAPLGISPLGYAGISPHMEVLNIQKNTVFYSWAQNFREYKPHSWLYRELQRDIDKRRESFKPAPGWLGEMGPQIIYTLPIDLKDPAAARNAVEH